MNVETIFDLFKTSLSSLSDKEKLELVRAAGEGSVGGITVEQYLDSLNVDISLVDLPWKCDDIEFSELFNSWFLEIEMENLNQVTSLEVSTISPFQIGSDLFVGSNFAMAA